jgi:hypothetical protein
LCCVWREGRDVDAAAREYAESYNRQFAKLFRRTALLRRAIAMPALLRRPLARVMQQGFLAHLMVKATRAGTLG